MTTQKEEPTDLMDSFARNRITIFLHATGYTIVNVAVISGLGYLLDQQLGTFPGFFITGLVLSFPLTMVLIYKKFKKFALKEIDKVK